MRRHLFCLGLFGGGGAAAIGCSRSSPPSASQSAPAASEASWQATEELLPRRRTSVTSEGAVVDAGAFPQITTDLADDPRRATVVALCTPCHSARYITAQPPLDAVVWQAEVTKMVEGFGAVIPEDKRADIIGYLTDHYGSKRGISPPAVPASPGAPAAPASAGAAAPQDLDLYKTHCIACHGATGQGIPGAFPPLAQHGAALGQSAAGRSYMVDVVLYGAVGAIQVDGVAFNNMMPPLGGRLSDAEIAAVLNGVRQRWPRAGVEFVEITAADVKSQRAREKSPQQVNQDRPTIAH